GDYATGWSMGWKVNLWARMYDGDKALQILSKLLRLVKENDPNFSGSGSYPNLFDAHPPFQIDGNFGATAGIVEMLLQSHDGYVHLLPALPNKWQQGFISGIKSRGGFEIEMQWQNSILNKGKIKSHAGGVLPIKSSIPLKISGGKVLTQSQENHLLKPIAEIEYLNVDKVQYAPMKFPKFYTYTIATEIGDVITMEAAVQKKTKR
ncbi:MAG: glycoside hydrolase family 95 protein, partial [Cyclobacteriaceae bacterium]|nr:glycoside hydrolase family 95 protein [Cyclobacteriaceae bacterium]